MTAYNETLLILRRKAGRTQREAAAFLDVNQSTISKIETGEQTATVDQLLLLCELYGAEVSIQGAPLPRRGFEIPAGAGYCNARPKC